MNDAHETLVRDLLHRATDDLTAPATSLTATAVVRGRSLRRRRRAVAAVGTLCAVTLVAVPLVTALGGSNPTTGPQIATDPTPTPSATPTPQPTPHLVDNDAWAQMPAGEMATTFESLAPADIGLTDVMLTNEERAPGEPETDSPGYLRADLTLDGETVGGLNAILYVTGQRASRYSCPGNLTSPDQCVEIVLIVQQPDRIDAPGDHPDNWTLVAGDAADADTLADLAFAWRACRAVKSNAILLAHGGASVGVGMGQVNRVDSCRLAVERAGDRAAGSVAASDAFFPFADGPGILIAAGVRAIVQPGGSMRDRETIEAAQAAGVTMYFTGTRHFFH